MITFTNTLPIMLVATPAAPSIGTQYQPSLHNPFCSKYSTTSPATYATKHVSLAMMSNAAPTLRKSNNSALSRIKQAKLAVLRSASLGT